MARNASFFVCQQCGTTFPKWSGRCSQCGAWNSLVETMVSTRTQNAKRHANGRAGKTQNLAVKPIRLSEVTGVAEKRIPTGIGELDRVLGGGIVPGSVVLVAGEPGIGKSTLLTQLALRVANSIWHMANSKRGETKPSAIRHTPSAVLYVCGEENPGQIKLRVGRLEASLKFKVQSAKLFLLPEVDVDAVVSTIEKEKPGLVIVDSIQTMMTGDLTSSAGSVGQVSESTRRLISVAKALEVPVFLVGHVTKEGAIAGPKILEHMVDVVLELSGDMQHEFRLLRTTKNRFGTTDEVGVFVMEEVGLEEVLNPSDRFLEDRQDKVSGSAVVCVLEGTRPMLVEIQALVVPSQLAIPRRVASGVDLRRVQILVAVLTKRCGLRLGDADVYVNVAGGLTIREPASDFGIAMAIASSNRNRALPTKTAFIGEVGLLGEVRKVGRLNQRLAEAKAQGFSRVVSASEYRSLAAAVRALL